MTTSPSYLISHNTTNSDCCSGDRCPGGPVSLRPRVWRHNLILIYRTPPLCSTQARPLFAYQRDKEDLSSTVILNGTLSRFWAQAIYPAWWLIVYCTPLLLLLCCYSAMHDTGHRKYMSNLPRPLAFLFLVPSGSVLHRDPPIFVPFLLFLVALR